MPINKNAIRRYKILDGLLSRTDKHYSMTELHNKVNEKLEDEEFGIVTKRCIEKDLKALTEIFSVEYEGYDDDKDKVTIYKEGTNKPYYTYAEGTDPIFTQKLTNDEKEMMNEILNMLGKIDGLENFDWLTDFKRRLELDNKESKKTISFQENKELVGSDMLGKLFIYTSSKTVLRIQNKEFNKEDTEEHIIHPYLLKQYNNRWFLIAYCQNKEEIRNYALDRIIKDSIKEEPEIEFFPCKEDLEERFEGIIGVTKFKDEEPQEIIFWVSETEYKYIQTKPIHPSQKELKRKKEMYMARYPNLAGGYFFSIECAYNIELIKTFMSEGLDGLVVLEPERIKNKIAERIISLSQKYI